VFQIAIAAAIISVIGVVAQLRKRNDLTSSLAKALDSEDFPIAEEASFHNYIGLVSWGFILLAAVTSVFIKLHH